MARHLSAQPSETTGLHWRHLHPVLGPLQAQSGNATSGPNAGQSEDTLFGNTVH